MEVLARRQLTTAFWLVGSASIAVAALFGLDRRWALTGACVVVGLVLLWLCGRIALPVGKDALWRYFGRVWAAWHDWATAWSSAHYAEVRASDQLRDRLKRLTPPPAFAADHAQLVELLAGAAAVANDTSVSPFEPYRRAAAAARAARAARERLIEETSGEPGPYAAALERLKGDSAAHVDKTTRDRDRAATALFRSLRRLNPPAAVRAEHELLITSLEHFVDADRAQRSAFDANADEEALRRAFDEWNSAWTRVERAYHEVQKSLSDQGAWPGVRNPTQTASP